MFAIRTKRHRLIASHPFHELLVGPHKSKSKYPTDDCSQFVNNLISTLRLLRDVWVQFDKRFAQFSLKEDIGRRSAELGTMDIRPSQLRHTVENHRLNSVGLIEWHEHYPFESG